MVFPQIVGSSVFREKLTPSFRNLAQTQKYKKTLIMQMMSQTEVPLHVHAF